MSEPKTTYIRYRQLVEWLESEGHSEAYVRKWIKEGIIKKIYIGRNEKAKYQCDQVRNDVLTGSRGSNSSPNEEAARRAAATRKG